MPLDWSILTPQENRVVELVGTGADNNTIARDLCISVETVKRHLCNIFDKVGCGSRVELALWWVTRDSVSREEFNAMQAELGQIIDELGARLRMMQRMLKHSTNRRLAAH